MVQAGGLASSETPPNSNPVLSRMSVEALPESKLGTKQQSVFIPHPQTQTQTQTQDRKADSFAFVCLLDSWDEVYELSSPLPVSPPLSLETLATD